MGGESFLKWGQQEREDKYNKIDLLINQSISLGFLVTIETLVRKSHIGVNSKLTCRLLLTMSRKTSLK